MRFASHLLGIAALFLVASGAFANTNGSAVNIDAQLPGTYEYINVNGLLNITTDNSILLNLICPRKVAVAAGSPSGTFRLQIGDPSLLLLDVQCHVRNSENVTTSIKRVELATTKAAGTGLATLEDLRNHFPLFYGNFSDHPLLCPALESSTETTNLAVQDTGYIYSLLNHYEVSKLPLGEFFDTLNKSSFERIRGTYSISLTLDPSDVNMGCEYIQSIDKQELQRRTNEITTPSPSPSRSPNASAIFSAAPLTTSPSPTPSSSPKTGSHRRACFPGDVLVKLSTGPLVRIKDLRVGQSVLDSAGSFSKVILFTHSDPAMLSEFVHIRTARAEIVLSASHYVYTAHSMVPAGSIRLGDQLITISGNKTPSFQEAEVESIDRRVMHGLFNPHTSSGKVAIFWKGDAVLASTYTTAVDPKTAHFLLMPLRWLEERTEATLPVISRFFEKGNNFWPSVLRSMAALKLPEEKKCF